MGEKQTKTIMGSNTIYDYYTKISDRFWIARSSNINGKINIRYIWQPLARRIMIPGFEDFDFFIYKDLEFKKDRCCYYLCEGLTGAVVLRQCDLESRIMRRAKLKLFIDCLPAELNKKGGRANLNQFIVDFLVEYEQEYSPRYGVNENL